MILADKIALLRRQKGWSQEELAGFLGVSRQAVSKWEGGASIPDLDKILGMSGLFGVSTDYLLKDALEQPDAPETAVPAPEDKPEPLRQITLDEANAYLDLVARVRGRIALGVGLFILSPAALLQLGAWADATPRENLACGLGMIMLLVLVALGLALVIPAGIRLGEYDYLEKESFTLAYGVAGIVEQSRRAYAPVFSRCITVGVMLCVLGVVPIVAAMALDVSDFAAVFCVNLLLAAVAVAVQPLIRAGMVQESFDKLLQAGDYTAENKRLNRRTGWFAGAYWCAVTALYLGVSFWQDSWKTSWIVWPVAGVLFAALSIALRAWAGRNRQPGV